MAKSLLLFDIDGTLMITKGAGSRCLERAGRMVFGEEFEFTKFTVGTLDPEIFAHLALHNEIDHGQENLARFRETYLKELEQELVRIAHDILIMPGITELLETLRPRLSDQGDLVLGILTGNYKKAATLKLDAAGFDWSMFPVTAFAEDGKTRNDLPRVAMDQFEKITGEKANPQQTFIIGDTPRDIECAKAHGCVSIAVATGRYRMNQLQEAGGDVVVESLADPAPLLERLG